MSIFANPYDQSLPPDLLSFVTHPYAKVRDIDPVSKLYQVMQSTRSSPAIAIFYLFALMSHWNLRKGVTYRIPGDIKTHDPNLWLMALAPSGSSKTQQVNLVNALLPFEDLRETFNQPASPVSLIEQFKNDPVHFWVEDEAAKFIRLIENPTNSLAPLKGHLLKVKGGDTLTYHSKRDGEIVIKKPRLALFFLNTIKGMTDAISEESMVDGFLSRIGIVISEMTPELAEEIASKHPANLHNLSVITESGIQDDLRRMFSQHIENSQYTFDGAVATYEEAVTSLRSSFAWMQGEHNKYLPFFNRTVLESFKYSIFHHQMLLKPGTEIDDKDMEFGLRVARFTLCSLARFESLKFSGSPQRQAQRVAYDLKLKDRISRFVQENPGANLRDIYRNFSLTKGMTCQILKELGLLQYVLTADDRVPKQMKLPKPPKKS